MKQKLIDFLVLGLLMLVASIYSYKTANTTFGTPLFMAAVFLVLPIIYLSLIEKKDWKKISASILLLGLIIGFVFTFIAEQTDAWTMPFATNKAFDFMSFENVVAMMLMVALTIVFYQHFFINKSDQVKGLSKKYPKVFLILMSFSVIMVLLFNYKPDLLFKNYSYLKIGSINLLIPIIFVIRNPTFLSRVFLPGIYFSILYFTIELIALDIGWWTFEGSYVGFFSFFGHKIPVEEFLYWILLYAPTIICCYESFINNSKEKAIQQISV